jgi:hypothetical protein
MALLTALQCSCSLDQFSIEEDEPAEQDIKTMI